MVRSARPFDDVSGTTKGWKWWLVRHSGQPQVLQHYAKQRTSESHGKDEILSCWLAVLTVLSFRFGHQDSDKTWHLSILPW